MYTRSFRSIPTVLNLYKFQFMWYAPYVTMVYVAYHYFGYTAIDIKMSIATVLGFAVALVLSFRTAASYDRWWEARKIWGGIVNDSRTLVRQLIGFTDVEVITPETIKMTHYQIAWCKALRNSLRGLNPIDELENHLTPEEIQYISKRNNKPNEILKLMEKVLHQLKKEGKIDTYQMVALDHTLKNLCDHMGKCERINNTVFPTQYRSFTHMGIVIFLLMLPYGMLYSTGPFVILISVLVSFCFSMLENIAFYMQDPFNNRDADIPMSALSRTIEINLRELIGEEVDLKPMVPGKNGVLL